MSRLEEMLYVPFVHMLKFLQLEDVKNLRLTSTSMNKKTKSADARLRLWKIQLSAQLLADSSFVNSDAKIDMNLNHRFMEESSNEIIEWIERHGGRIERLETDIKSISQLMDASVRLPEIKRLSVYEGWSIDDGVPFLEAMSVQGRAYLQGNVSPLSGSKITSTLMSVLNQGCLDQLELVRLNLSQIPVLDSGFSNLTMIRFKLCPGNFSMKNIIISSARTLTDLKIEGWARDDMNMVEVLGDDTEFPKLNSLYISTGPANNLNFIHEFVTSPITLESVHALPETLARLSTSLSKLSLSCVDLSGFQEITCQLMSLKEMCFSSCSSCDVGLMYLLSKTRCLEKLTVLYPDKFDFSRAVSPLPALKEVILISRFYQPVKGIETLLKYCGSTLTRLVFEVVQCPFIPSDLPQLKILFIDSISVSFNLCTMLGECWRTLENLYVSENSDTSINFNFIEDYEIEGFPALRIVELLSAEGEMEVMGLDVLLNRCYRSLETLTVNASFPDCGSLHYDFLCLKEITLEQCGGEGYTLCQLISRSQTSLRKLNLSGYKKLDFSPLTGTNLVLPKLEDLSVKVRSASGDEPSSLTAVSLLIQACRLNIRNLYLCAALIPDFDETNVDFPVIKTIKVDREVYF